jgi:hypothetical protein
MKRWPLFVVAGASSLLILSRMYWRDNLFFDQTSLILFAVAAMALLLCYIPMKRVKVGQVEIEMDLAQLGRDIKEAREALAEDSETRVVPKELPIQIADLLKDASRNPGGVLLALCAALEQKVRERLGEEAGRFLSVEEAMKLGVHQGVFPPETLPAFRRFWRIKNHVVQDNAFHVETSVVLTLIANTVDLLKLISSEPNSAIREVSVANQRPNIAMQPTAK